jgi:Flp pilus assembly protein TadG
VTRRTDRGSALVEFTWLALLLMVPLLYIVLAVFAVQRSAFAVSAAAQAAGRAFVLSPSEAAARPRAVAAATVALDDQRLDLDRASVTFSCDPDPGNCLAPGETVEVSVSYPVPLPLVPAALGGDTPSIRVQAVHRVPYGRYREDRP